MGVMMMVAFSLILIWNLLLSRHCPLFNLMKWRMRMIFLKQRKHKMFLFFFQSCYDCSYGEAISFCFVCFVFVCFVLIFSLYLSCFDVSLFFFVYGKFIFSPLKKKKKKKKKKS